jgi:hypothetical protein
MFYAQIILSHKPPFAAAPDVCLYMIQFEEKKRIFKPSEADVSLPDMIQI